jgi:hypothetical protein
MSMKGQMFRSLLARAWSLLGVVCGLVGTQAGSLWLRLIGIASALLFAVLFCCLVTSDWLTIYQSHATARELARLRGEGRKRYIEWWTFCHTGQAIECEERAEALRLRVIELLVREVSAQEADYFNNSRGAEPFPQTNLRLCPQAVRINEFGYRLERLGEIIQRIDQRGRLPIAA